ncbi:TSUP family transporter [Peribacillus frigoritolerans]|uniref:TSUP family transporter n=1 Tax=Peribacillus frigoritolerans TaxID=450367 RepID=UPI003F6BE6BD
MFSSFSSFYILLKKKQLKLKDALQLIPFALFGGLCGGLLANSFSGKAMNLLAICLLTVALIMNFIKNRNLPMNRIGISQKKFIHPIRNQCL